MTLGVLENEGDAVSRIGREAHMHFRSDAPGCGHEQGLGCRPYLLVAIALPLTLNGGLQGGVLPSGRAPEAGGWTAAVMGATE